jgi:hypothetical protein
MLDVIALGLFFVYCGANFHCKKSRQTAEKGYNTTALIG